MSEKGDVSCRMVSDFMLVRIGLLGAPALALVTLFFLRHRRFPARSVVVAGCLLLLYLAIALAGLRFVTARANLACSIVAYFAYSLLTVMSLRIPNAGIRFPLFVIAIIPIGCGYLLTTIRPGLSGLATIVVLYHARPNHVDEVAPGLICRITDLSWGGQLSYFHFVGLYQSWNWAPLLERKVLGAASVENFLGEEGPSCADLVAKYENP